MKVHVSIPSGLQWLFGTAKFQVDIKEKRGRRADLIIWLTLSGEKVNRPLHGCEGMLGNQDKLVGSQKVVWEFNFN